MDNIFIWVFVLAAIIIFFLSWYFSKKQILLRKMNAIKIKDIQNVKSGEMVRIIGEVEFMQEPKEAPLSNRKCCFYEVEVERKVTRGKHTSWDTIIKERKYHNFVVKQENNYVLIDTRHIDFYLVQDRKYNSGFLDDASPVLEKFLKKHGRESTGWLGFNKTLRYKESVLEKGERVSVAGTAVWVDESDLDREPVEPTAIATTSNLPDVTGNYTVLPDRFLVLHAPKGGRIFMSDDPGSFLSKR